MSWEKMTVNHSELDSVLKTLKKLKVKYSVKQLGEAVGLGINDGDGETYPIRQLAFKNYVIIERMLRSCNCDLDDVIVSYEFTKSTLPKSWPLEVIIDEEE